MQRPAQQPQESQYGLRQFRERKSQLTRRISQEAIEAQLGAHPSAHGAQRNTLAHHGMRDVGQLLIIIPVLGHRSLARTVATSAATTGATAASTMTTAASAVVAAASGARRATTATARAARVATTSRNRPTASAGAPDLCRSGVGGLGTLGRGLLSLRHGVITIAGSRRVRGRGSRGLGISRRNQDVIEKKRSVSLGPSRSGLQQRSKGPGDQCFATKLLCSSQGRGCGA